MRNKFVSLSIFIAILLFVVPVSVQAKHTSGSSSNDMPITFPTIPSSNGSSNSSTNTNVQTPNATHSMRLPTAK